MSRPASLRQRLEQSRLYLCTDTRSQRGDLPEFLESVLEGGVDIVQLREKRLEARQELEALEVVADACRRHGALFAVNDRADLAYAARADVLHLGQDDLPVPFARAICDGELAIGRSTHDGGQLRDALEEAGSDYFCVGPCWETATKPGRPATGLALVAEAAALSSAKPWFAIGGISLDRLDAVLEAGASRVVVVRAITEADDPEAAARAFSERLANESAGM